jgi:hypothetical protein
MGLGKAHKLPECEGKNEKKKSNDTLNKMAMYKLTELSRISWHLLAYVREPVEF